MSVVVLPTSSDIDQFFRTTISMVEPDFDFNDICSDVVEALSYVHDAESSSASLAELYRETTTKRKENIKSSTGIAYNVEDGDLIARAVFELGLSFLRLFKNFNLYGEDGVLRFTYSGLLKDNSLVLSSISPGELEERRERIRNSKGGIRMLPLLE